MPDRTGREHGYRLWPVTVLLCVWAAVLAGTAARADDPRVIQRPEPAWRYGAISADQVFGRWVVMRAPIGMPMRTGEQVEFRRDGVLEKRSGPCRYAVLRAELTVSCTDKSERGELRFVDENKLIWRLNGHEMLFVAPTD